MFEKIRLINQLLSNFRRDGCEELPLVMNVMLENLSIVVNYICAATKFPPWVFRPERIYVVCILICFQATAHGKVMFSQMSVYLGGGGLFGPMCFSLLSQASVCLGGRGRVVSPVSPMCFPVDMEVWDTVGKWAVCILLEYFLVTACKQSVQQAGGTHPTRMHSC